MGASLLALAKSIYYILLKIHKTENPGRPIVSSNSHPTERISQFVDYHIHRMQIWQISHSAARA